MMSNEKAEEKLQFGSSFTTIKLFDSLKMEDERKCYKKQSLMLTKGKERSYSFENGIHNIVSLEVVSTQVKIERRGSNLESEKGKSMKSGSPSPHIIKSLIKMSSDNLNKSPLFLGRGSSSKKLTLISPEREDEGFNDKKSFNLTDASKLSSFKPLLSLNLNTEDKVNQNEAQCKICYEGETSTKKLFSPCKCQGSVKFIHESCLKEWFADIDVYSNRPKCSLCKHEFELEFIYNKFFSTKKFLILLRNIFVALAVAICCLVVINFLIFIIIDSMGTYPEDVVKLIKNLSLGISGFFLFLIIILYLKNFKDVSYERTVIDWAVKDFNPEKDTKEEIKKLFLGIGLESIKENRRVYRQANPPNENNENNNNNDNNIAVNPQNQHTLAQCVGVAGETNPNVIKPLNSDSEMPLNIKKMASVSSLPNDPGPSYLKLNSSIEVDSEAKREKEENERLENRRILRMLYKIEDDNCPFR